MNHVNPSLAKNTDRCLEKDGVFRASSFKSLSSRLPSDHPSLDALLEGGLRFGELSEWGMPFGCGGRQVILAYLAQATQSAQWSLWVSGKDQVEVYPPAWSAQGVSLKWTRFAYSKNPVQDLRPLFLDPFFRVIVLDAPSKFSGEDCAFLAQQARKYGQAVILLRDYFLSEKYGNIWARLRLNCWQEVTEKRFHLQVVRGLSPRRLSFSMEEDTCL